LQRIEPRGCRGWFRHEIQFQPFGRSGFKGLDDPPLKARAQTQIDEQEIVRLDAFEGKGAARGVVGKAVLAQLLAAAGKPDEARERLNAALQLGEETGVNFYRAELLRLRAHTNNDTDDRDADLRAAIDTARQQSSSIFELRAAIDDFELHGEPSRDTLADAISRFSVDSDWPDLVRARTLLG